MRVYGQALARIADAEVKLFHLFVHEPLIRDGRGGLEIAEEMEDLASDLLPLASPIMDHVHQRWLQHFIEQDAVGHLEIEVDGETDLGRLRVAIAFADLAGYTRLTEDAGEEEALDVVERFVGAVEETLPDDARVDQDDRRRGDGRRVRPVGARRLGGRLPGPVRRAPLPRIGVHAGGALYRDGDYFGRSVNLASRVGARAAGGEVLVTRPVVEAAGRAPALRAGRRGPVEGLQRDHGAVPGGAPVNASLLRGDVLVLLSGGRDSVCLLDLAVEHADRVEALHVDYGAGRRRASARSCASGSACRCTWCGRATPEGNFQAWARDVRYAEAERLARGVIAVGHTATDQVETVLYRLAASPGRRALLGMGERSGRVVRPLLGMTREETAAYCRARGLEWREDPSNDSDAFARNRARHGLVPALRELHPAAEANVLRTLATLRDEAEVLDALVDEALTDEVAGLEALPPALARLCLERLAGAPVGARAREILQLRTGGSLDLGGGLRVVEEYGRLRFSRGPAPPAAEPAALAVPGRAAFAGGELTCEVRGVPGRRRHRRP